MDTACLRYGKLKGRFCSQVCEHAAVAPARGRVVRRRGAEAGGRPQPFSRPCGGVLPR